MPNPHVPIEKQQASTVRENVVDVVGMSARLMPEVIKRSWKRSRERGLSTSDSLLFNEVTQAHQRFVEERSRKLIRMSTPELTALHGSLAKNDWMLACVDSEGTVVSAVGSPREEFKNLRLALRTGVELGENAAGTTGPGCALIERKPVIVSGCDHFLQEARNFQCVAVPIFDPHGNLIGALDASSSHQTNAVSVVESLAIAGRAVENNMVFALKNATFIRFHHRPDMVGTPLEGILAFSHDGCLLGSNQTARHILAIDSDASAPIGFDALFGIPFHRAVDTLHASQQTPIWIDGLNGMRMHARIGTNKDIDQETLRTTRIVSGVNLKNEIHPASSLTGGVGMDSVLTKLLDQTQRAFARDIPILINGETGTGKEVVARLLHSNGPRSSGPFVAINCSSIPASLIESELFGYEEGAFTGGRRGGAIGKLEQANGGTLFLDEIGDMPIELQGCLLRVLQERNFTRLGSATLVSIDTSVICATHRNLDNLVKSNGFREDLYYRINGLRVALPPLRERNDIRKLIDRCLEQATSEFGALRLSEAAMHVLLRYRWPGNIRQLHYVIRLAAVLAEDEGVIELHHLPREIVDQRSGKTGDNPLNATELAPQSLSTLEQSERDAIRASLQSNNGNISATARDLGIARQTLYRKLKLFCLEDLAAGADSVRRDAVGWSGRN